MLQHILELDDGRIFLAGDRDPAVMWVELTQSVNSGEALTLGSVCAAMAKVGLYTAGSAPLTQGDAFTLYEENEAGVRTKIGRFFAEEPRWNSPNILSVTAYDPVTLLDKDITTWLQTLTAWPYTLWELADMVCRACGTTFATPRIPNGSHPVQQIAAQGITGRQLLGWIAQAAGCFCKADPSGNVVMDWYSATDLTYGPTAGGDIAHTYQAGDLAVVGDFTYEKGQQGPVLAGISGTYSNGDLRLESGSHYYYQNGLQLAEFSTAPVEKLQLCAKEEDVGTVYPDVPGAVNTYRILGNPLLTQQTAETLLPVAQTLYERLQQVTYTPGKLVVPAGTSPMPGQIVSVLRTDGTRATLYVMERFRSGSRDTITCTGTARLDSVAAVNNQSYRTLSGKVMRLRTDVEGILAENADSQGRLAKLELDVQGISATVQAVNAGTQTALTTLQQTAESISATVQTLTETGADKLSTAFGLTIDGSAVTICREGSEMKNRLDERGMDICRGEDVMLRADSDGVLATDVTVRNYLVVGDHARLEDYGSGRTACFYV